MSSAEMTVELSIIDNRGVVTQGVGDGTRSAVYDGDPGLAARENRSNIVEKQSE